jgi:hypothetical protein
MLRCERKLSHFWDCMPASLSFTPGCVNEAGEAVDWWFLYKHPRWTDASHKTCIAMSTDGITDG